MFSALDILTSPPVLAARNTSSEICIGNHQITGGLTMTSERNKMTLTPTEQEELRIAIATEMGIAYNAWSPIKSPPYTTSIDAIQAACLERFGDLRGSVGLGFELLTRAESRNVQTWQLTALDWCTTFARRAKIWRYKV